MNNGNKIRIKKIAVNTNGLIEIIVAICIGFVFLADIFSNYRQIILCAAYVLALVIFYYDCKCLKLLRRKLLILNAFLLIIATINLIFIENVTFPFLAKFFLLDQSIALFFLGRENLSEKIWCFFGVIIYAVLWYCMIHSVNGYTLFAYTSRNYVSVYSLFVLFLLVVVHYKNNTKFPGVLVWHNLVLCVFSVGRGGIISAAILFALYYMILIKKNKKLTKKIEIVGSLLIIAIIILYYMYTRGLLNVVWEKYLWRFYDNRSIGSNQERMSMLREYMTETLGNVFYFLFGSDISKLSLIKYQNGNIHNSYFMLHKAFGVLGGTVLLGYAASFAKVLWKSRAFDLLMIMAVIMFRALFDSCFPYHILNIPFMYMAIGCFYKKTISNEDKRKN